MPAVYHGTFFVHWEGNCESTGGGWAKKMGDIIYDNNLKPTVDKISNLGDLSAALTTEWPSNHPDGRYLSGNIPGGRVTFKILNPAMHDKVELAEVGQNNRLLGDIKNDGIFGILLSPWEPVVDDEARAGEKHATVTIRTRFELFGDRGSLQVS